MHSGYTLPQAEREAAFVLPERPRRRTEVRSTACPPFPGTVLGKGGPPDEAEEARPDACSGLTKEAAGSAVPGK